MKWYIWYTVRLGMQLILRNKLLSVLAIVLIAFTQTALLGVLITRASFGYVQSAIERRVDVTVSFLPGIPDQVSTNLANDIAQLPEVVQIRVVSDDVILEQFEQRHKNDFITLQALDELDNNPFGVQLHIQTKQATEYETVAKFIQESPTVSDGTRSAIERISITSNKPVLDRIVTIGESMDRISVLAVIVISVAAMVLLGFITRFLVETKREEIVLMRALGAASSRVVGQLGVAYAVYAVMGAAISLVVGYMGIALLSNGLQTVIPGFALAQWFVPRIPLLAVILVSFGIVVTHLVLVFTVFRKSFQKLL